MIKVILTITQVTSMYVGKNTSNVNPVTLLSSHPKLQISAI